MTAARADSAEKQIICSRQSLLFFDAKPMFALVLCEEEEGGKRRRQKCNESKEEGGKEEGAFSVAKDRTWMNDKEL